MSCHRSLPRMLSRTAAKAIFRTRQREGLGASLGLDAGFRGGGFRDVPGIAFSYQEGSQLGVDPGLCELGFLGGEFIKAGDALHSLEGKFDLPAKAVDREHV